MVMNTEIPNERNSFSVAQTENKSETQKAIQNQLLNELKVQRNRISRLVKASVAYDMQLAKELRNLQNNEGRDLEIISKFKDNELIRDGLRLLDSELRERQTDLLYKMGVLKKWTETVIKKE
jgi:molecular chaperone GrpE (heat shock protein)